MRTLHTLPYPLARRLPKFLTASQYAAKIGKSSRWVLGMLKEDRIPEAQWLPLGWIVPEDAQIILRRADILLPPELVLNIVPREPPEYKGRPTPIPPGDRYVMVELPGYAKVADGYSQRDIQRLTGVSPTTQRRIREGKKSSVEVAWKLARGLSVDMDELLRRR